MNDDLQGWFHCGRCGQLFKAALGEGPRVCENCGSNPSIFNESLVKLQQTATPAVVIPARRPDSATDEAPGRKRTIRKRRGNMMVIKICGAWIIVLTGIVVISRMLVGEDPQQTRKATALPVAGDDVETTTIKNALPGIGKGFGEFLNSATPEEFNQYVRDPVGTAGKMARYYAMNPTGKVGDVQVSLTANRLFTFSGQQAIVAVFSVADGRKLDAVFFHEDGEWRLDWQQFTRYSDFPWALFLAGSEEQVGEFRLLARERLAKENAASGNLSVVLYAPRFGFPAELGYASPEFVVSRDSENGRLLAAGFKAAREGKRPFDGSLSKDDPEGMLRVRVKIRRIQDERGRRFELEKVLACHWISVDEPGVVPLSDQQVEEQRAAARNGPQAPKPAE